jgi:DNA-directed RNA polymerase subunit RPC12/RpoP
MAGAIGVAAVLAAARLTKVICPYCGHVQRFAPTPDPPDRVCPRCGRRFAQPVPPQRR